MTVELDHDSPVSLWNGPNCNKSYLKVFHLEGPQIIILKVYMNPGGRENMGTIS